MRGPLGLVLMLTIAAPAAATPLVGSSEETPARMCLARTDTPDRIVAACDAALTSARLSATQRSALLTARGDGQLWQGEPRAAIESYRAALGSDPLSVEAWNGLGWVLWETEGDLAARQAFEASLEIDVSVQGLGGAAATGRRAGIIGNDEARNMLKAALAIDPVYIWAHREIGWSHLDDDDPAEAADAFAAALAIDEDDANALYGLGRARLRMGQAEDALALFDKSLGSEPQSFVVQVFRLTALRQLDRNAHVVREAERLIADHPEKASGYIEKGRALMALERRAEAIETYAGAEDTVGPNNAILYWHADALAADARFAEALKVIERGLTLDGADYSDHLMKSYIALELGNYRMAREAAEASLAGGVDDPWAHYYIAIALVHEGDPLAGVERFKRALAAGLPEDRVGTFAKELILAGRFQDAAELRLNP